MEKVQSLQDTIIQKKRKTAIIQKFISQLEQIDSLFDKFSPNLWTGLCEKMTIHSDDTVTVTFKSGTEITV